MEGCFRALQPGSGFEDSNKFFYHFKDAKRSLTPRGSVPKKPEEPTLFAISNILKKHVAMDDSFSAAFNNSSVDNDNDSSDERTL